MSTTLPLRVALAAALVLLSSAASAQVILPPLPPETTPTEADVQAAEAAYERASAAYAKGDLEAALAEATIAWETLPNASTALTRAVVFGALGRDAEAFSAYLVAGELGPTDAELEVIDAGLSRHGPALDPPHGWVTVVTRPVDASVEVDGATFAAPRRVGVTAGRHHVHLTADGYVRFDGGFEVKAGVGQRLEYELTKVASVIVEPPPVIIKDDTPPAPIIEWIMVGAGSAAIIAGSLFHIGALSAADDTALYAKPGAEGLDEATRRLLHQQAVDDAEDGRTAAISLYGLGGALVVTGVTLLLLEEDEPPADGDVDEGPSILPAPGGATLLWQF